MMEGGEAGTEVYYALANNLTSASRASLTTNAEPSPRSQGPPPDESLAERAAED